VSDVQIGLLTILGILILVQSGMHVAVALIVLSFVGVWAIKDNWTIAGSMLQLTAYEGIKAYNFGVIPLFVLMGLLVSVSGIGSDTFRVAAQAFRKLRGGLGVSTVAANAIFAAVNGSSIASASVFTKIAVPELLRLGYTPRFAVGVVAGSSVLGMLIPPSMLLIVLGIAAELSIGDLFTAGIMPGILLAAAFCVTIMILVRFFPGFVGEGGIRSNEDMDLMPTSEMLKKVTPIVLLIMVVLGGIYGGIFTPIEAGAVGALGALILTILRRKLNRQVLWRVLIETGYVASSILFLLVAAHLYSNMLALSGLPYNISQWVAESGLGFWPVLGLYLLIIILMGTILDSPSIILIVVPLIVPIMTGFEVHLIWFGIVTIIAVEIGLLTPPFGLACFTIKTNLDDPRITLNDIFIGAAPFVLTMLVVLGIVVAVPWLALGLL